MINRPSFSVMILALMLALLMVSLVTALQTTCQENISLVYWLHSTMPLATAQIADLYSIRSDVTVKDDLLDLDGLRLSPENISAAVVTMALANDYQRISDLAQQSSEACRNRPACRLLAGKAHLRLGRDALAAEVWAGDHALWARLIGNTAMTPRTEEDLQFMERYYGILRSINPDNAAPYFMLGSIYRSMGGWQKSISFFEQAVTIEPHNARYLCALGQSLVVTGQNTTRGIELCNAAQSLSPQDMWVQEQAARTLALAGECIAAGKIYEYIAHTFTERVEARNWLTAFRDGKIGECNVPIAK